MRATLPHDTALHAAPGAVLGGFAWALRWLLLLILMALPLDAYFVLPPDRPVAFLSQVLTAEAIVLLGVAFAIAALIRRPAPLVFDWRDALPLALVALTGFLSITGASVRSDAVKGCLKLLVYLGLFVLARSVAGLPGIRRASALIIMLTFCLVLVMGSLGTIPGTPDIAGALLNIHRSPAGLPGTDILRAEATFRYPNEFAAYLIIVLPLLVAFAVRAETRAEQAAFWVLATVGTWLLALTYTRGALVAFLIVLPLVLLLIGGKKYGVVGLLITLGVVALLVVKDGAQRNRLLSILDPGGVGYSIRVAIWSWALHAVRMHPLFGVGMDNLRYQPHAPVANPALHQTAVDAENLWLNVAAELGLVGILAVAACFVGAFRRVWRGLQRDGDWLDQSWNAGTLGALCAILLYGLVDPVLVSGQVTGLLCVLVGLAGVHVASPAAAPPVGMRAAAPVARRTPALSVRPRITGHPVAQLERLDARVVLLVNSPGTGGAERHSLNLAADLRARGIDVLVVCPPGAPLLADLDAHQIPGRELNLGRNLGRWRGYLGFAAFLNPISSAHFKRVVIRLAAETPSLFVCPFPREQLLTAPLSRRHGIRAVWVIHTRLHYLPHRVFLRRLFVKRSRSAGAIIAVSRGLADVLVAEGVDPAAIHVVPNAVAKVPPPQSAKVVEYALAGRPRDIAVASRLTHLKGVQHLITAMPAIISQVPDARLLIAGSGHYERELRSIAHRLGLDDHITFLGQIADTEWLLESARVFVCPSVDPGEVLPTAVLEALSHAVPVVATNIGSMSEVIKPGETGLLVASRDPAALAVAVVDLLRDPAAAARLAVAGQELVRTWYTFDRAGLAFLHLLRLVDQASPREQKAPHNPDNPRDPHEPSEPAASASAISATSGTLQAVNRSHFVRTTTLLFASKVLTALATSLWTILAARALLPREYGNLMLAAGIVELGAIITDAGVTTVATRELANVRFERARALIGAIVSLKLALGLVASAVIVTIALLTPMEPGARAILLVLAPSLLFVSLNSLTLVFRARVSVWQVLAVALLGALVTTYGAVFVYFSAPTLLNFAYLRLAAGVASGLAATFLVLFRYRPGWRPDPAIVRGLVVAALPLGIALALNIAYYRIDVPLLAIMRGSIQVAVYTAAYRILDVITLLPGAAAAMALPLMSGIARRSSRHLAVFATQYLEIAAGCGLLIAVVVTLFGDRLLTLLYAGKYATSGSTLTILGWVGAATFVTNVFTPLAIVLDRQRTVLVMAGVGLVFNVTLNLLLIPHWGPAGAAVATLFTEFVVTVPLAWEAYRRLHLRLFTRPLLAVLVATLGALLLSLLASGHGLDLLVRIGAVVVWVGLVVAIAPGWLAELAKVTKSRELLDDSFTAARSPVAPPADASTPVAGAPAEGGR